MQNPSYLLQSRHHIYYFRYPIPSISRVKGRSTHIQMSLNTRCPKEALRLAGVLEYHTAEILKHLKVTGMDYSEIVKRVRDYWAEILDKKKAEIDQSGLLSPRKVGLYRNEIENAEDIMANNWPEDELVYTDGSITTPTQRLLHNLGLPMSEVASTYDQFKKEGYYGRAWFFRELLKYNDSYHENAYGKQIPDSQVIGVSVSESTENQSPLRIAVDRYLLNIRHEGIAGRTFQERNEQLNLLLQLLGEKYDLYKFDIKKAAKVKDALRLVPKNRSKKKTTKDLPLREQMEVPDMEKLAIASINKYLTCFGSFMKWAHIHDLANSNPFQGMTLRDTKNKKKRDSFSIDQMKIMRDEIAKGEHGLANRDYKYWGALILLYTGARLNEIASLTVDDVKQKDSIWYFDINDEGDDKSLKTEAAKRIVPVHSDLIELGFLEFLQKSKNSREANGRLLYELRYTSTTRWGRMLGRWFNETLLPDLGLKTDRLVLHSLRHTVITMLQHADVEVPKIQGLVGHEPDTVTIGKYGNKYTLVQLQEAIESLKYV